MGMLDRYRKTGGFLQLLMLLETCGPAKQTKFLDMIAAEDHGWAESIRLKMLDIDRIYGWPEDTLAEIIGTLQDLTVAILYQTSQDEIKTRIHHVLPKARMRKIDDLLGSKVASNQEMLSTQMKVIEAVRKMANEGVLRFDKLDPQLVVDSDIDERLSKRSMDDVTMTSIPSFDRDEQTATNLQIVIPSPMHEPIDSHVTHSAELHSLRKRVAEMTRENASLRHDLSILKGKLDQIKKIA